MNLVISNCHTQGNINKYPVRYQQPGWLELYALKINMRPTLIIAHELSWLLITTRERLNASMYRYYLTQTPGTHDTDFVTNRSRIYRVSVFYDV